VRKDEVTDGYNNVDSQDVLSLGACALTDNSFIESRFTSYNKIYVRNPILFWMRYLCFINVNLALKSTGAITMGCLRFCTLFAVVYRVEALPGPFI